MNGYEKSRRLVVAIEALQKKPLTAEDVTVINEFQNTFGIDDDDPLIVVLALMARSQILVDSIPDLLQQKANETIELHRTVMRDQAVLISKELISSLSAQIYEQIQDKSSALAKVSLLKKDLDGVSNMKWISYFIVFTVGVAFAALLFVFFGGKYG